MKFRLPRLGRGQWITLAGILTFVAAVAALVSRATFSADTLATYPLLGTLDRHRIGLFIGALVAALLAALAVTMKELSTLVTDADERVFSSLVKQYDREMKQCGRRAERQARESYIAGIHDQNQNRWTEAIDHFSRSLSEVPTLGAYLGLGWCLWRTSRLKESQRALEKGLQLSQELNAHSREAEFHLNLGNVAGSLGDWDSALLYFQSAERWSGVLKDELGRVKAIGNIGLVWGIKGDHGKALEYHRQAFELHTTLSPVDAAIDLTNMARLEMSQGRLNEALNLARQALDLERTFSDSYVRGKLLLTVAQVQFSLGRIEEALAKSDEVISFCAGSGDRVTEAGALDVKGTCLTFLRRFDEAEPTLAMALRIHQECGDGFVGDALSAIGRLRIAEGKFNEALIVLAQAREAMVHRKPADRASVTIATGMASFGLGRVQEGASLFREALATFTVTGDKRGVEELRGALSIVSEFAQRQQSKEALPVLTNLLSEIERVRGRQR